MLETAYAFVTANAGWATIIAVAFVSIAIFEVIRYLVSRGPQIPTPPKMDDIGFIKWLGSYRDWYTQASGFCHNSLMVCRITPIFMGFLVAVVSALPDGISFIGIPKNIIVIILTGLSTLCVAVITQLGLVDLSRAREIGRIACARLLSNAQIFFSLEHTPQEIYEKKQAIHDEIFKIEMEQAALYAAIVAGPRKEPPASGNGADGSTQGATTGGASTGAASTGGVTTGGVSLGGASTSGGSSGS